MLPERPTRVGETVYREISSMILRGEIKDPRIGFVTLTAVEMSRDLKIAKVYYSVIGEELDREKTHEGLERAAGFIQHTIGKRLGLRYTPELRFYYDSSLEQGTAMQKLLREIE